MIDVTVKFTKENTWDYIRQVTFFKSKLQIGILISYIACCALLLIGGVISAIMYGEMFLLFLTAAGVVIIALYGVMMLLMMRMVSKKILLANAGDEDLSVSLNEDCITVRKSGAPVGLVEYSNIKDITVSKKAAYIVTTENSIIPLEFSAITHGTAEELKTLLDGKSNGKKTK